MSVGIIGLGYVGLPLAVAFAEAGHEVVGVDADARVVEGLAAGRSRVEDVTSARLAALDGRFDRDQGVHATSRGCDAVLICVPTPLANQREPDLTYITDAGRSLAGVLRADQLVVLESTTYPGTTRDRLQPILEESGLTAGTRLPPRLLTRADRSRAHRPLDPHDAEGRRWADRRMPRSSGRASTSEICDTVVAVSSPEAAEMTKLLENIFRSVNIAFVNELAQLCDRMGIDVWEVIDAAATKPYGFMRFDPGPGMGGHCLPVDPFYLAFKAREYDFPAEFVELAGKVNQHQPHYCVERIVRALNDVGKPARGSRLLLLGVSYKADVGDLREAPALKIAHLLRELGADVSYHDPHVPELRELELQLGRAR